MSIGREQAYAPEFSGLKGAYIRLLGFPAIGLQMRARRILPVVKREADAMRQNGLTPRICDAGCGHGALSFAIARLHPDYHVTGLEYEKPLVDRARQVAAASGATNATFEEWDITRPLRGGPWDIVVNIETLEHIEEHEAAARNLFEAVRPGGVLICHVPSYFSVMFGRQSVNIDVPGHVRPGYRGEELVQLLEGAGFQVESWASTYGSLETLCQRLSYRVTGAAMRNAGIYALLFPLLRVVAWFGRLSNPGKSGTNVLAVARRPQVSAKA